MDIRDAGPPYYSLARAKFDTARILFAQLVVVTVALAPKRPPSSRSVGVCILFSFVLTIFANTTRSQVMVSHVDHQILSRQHGFRVS
jgi:hypothetical protein